MVVKLGKILAEISAGELIDKITILEIKKAKITDKSKLIEIEKELSSLNSALKNNITECLFYDKFKKIQLRIKTKSFLLEDNDEIREYWDKVPLASRKSYSTKFAPSSILDSGKKGYQKEFLLDDNIFSNFCVVENYIKEVDFLSLVSDTHERMRIIIENNQIKIKELTP